MKKQMKLCTVWLIVLTLSVAGACSEEYQDDVVQGSVTSLTESEEVTLLPDCTALPETTPSPNPTSIPEVTSPPGESSLPYTEAPPETAEVPSAATYRYLTCTPGSEVPLYPSSTAAKPSSYLSRGTLVLVHEYADGRARVTFGGWRGWVSSGSLSSKAPATGERVGYRYAWAAGDSVPLYRYGFEYAIAYVPSGARVAITDMQEGGYTYVMHGAVSGWAKNSQLLKTLPEGAEAQEGSSYYYRTLVGDAPGQAVQLYRDSSCGSEGKCGTLPEGTVVKVLSTQLNVRISYGGSEYYVRPKNIFREMSGGSSNSIDTGITAPAPEIPDATEDAADNPPAPAQDESPSPTERPSSGRSGNRSSAPLPRVSVEVEYLGLLESCIVDARGERMVPTAELEFDSNAPADKRIAYIYAPSTGKCSLWKKASKKSDLIAKCKAGTVVMVLDYGRSFCRISYKGKEGYVLTSCLRFADADTHCMGTGVISYKGKTSGSTTVNIRGAGNGSAHRIAEWRTGTHVTVFSHKDGWYEVEYRGIHGWVQEKYLTLDE